MKPPSPRSEAWRGRHKSNLSAKAWILRHWLRYWISPNPLRWQGLTCPGNLYQAKLSGSVKGSHLFHAFAAIVGSEGRRGTGPGSQLPQTVNAVTWRVRNAYRCTETTARIV